MLLDLEISSSINFELLNLEFPSSLKFWNFEFSYLEFFQTEKRYLKFEILELSWNSKFESSFEFINLKFS